mgnify:CR=1 FL=1
MSNRILTALIALTSTIDPKVKLVSQPPQNGSNQWPQVVFNSYCYEKSGNSGATETRTRAMADLYGQAGELLAKEDPEGNFSVRSFYKDREGSNQPKLHIVCRPTGTTGATASMDVNAELADYTGRAAELGFDFATVPTVIASQPAAFLGFLKSAVAKLGSAAVTTEAAATVVQGDAPPV